MISLGLYGLAAIICALVAGMVLRGGQTPRRDRGATSAALLASALWCAAVAAIGPASALTQSLEILRNIAWVHALFRHFANDGRDESLRVVRQVVTALIAVEALQFVLLTTEWAGAEVPVAALLRMLVSVGALVLVHNLFGGASQASRRLLGWNSAGMALYWLFELNFFTIAYLTASAPVALEIARAVTIAAVAACFAIGRLQASAALAFRPSRAVTFSTLSLGVLAVYFIGMVGLANNVARLAGDLARVTQVGFLLAGAAAALLWLPSPRMRATAKVLALKHLFKHRYDYRAEWLRFTRTIGSAAGQGVTLQERAIQSLADITDSSAGLLLMPREDGDLTLAARWRWPTADVPASALPLPLARILERSPLILDLDEVRGGIDRFGEAALVPHWLSDDPAAWAAVPLLHAERLVGVVVLARPQVARRLDWEDFDLLTIAGQQVASYLSEQAGHEALQDAARFDEFNRRIAFVMHDIKNLSSQLGLLARNAERHADNPEFRKDMLVTLRNSADKLDALVKRLGRYGTKSAVPLAPVNLSTLGRRVAEHCAPHAAVFRGDADCEVLANAELLEQALIHLAQNAVEASDPDTPIAIEVRRAGLRGEITVIDAGKGMPTHFIQNGLFRPFVSTKENGFGIGACEARDHARAMGGRLDVDSREGLGSRFTVSLPLAEAARMLAGRALSAHETIEGKAA